MTRELGTLKEALNDYVNDNYNQAKQGNFLKTSQSHTGFSLPLKESQIKVARRDKVLIKQPQKKTNKKEDSANARYYGMGKDKQDYKEYDLKQNKVVEMQKKKKKFVNQSSDSESEEF